MIKCTNCGYENPDGATTCQQCQQPLAQVAAPFAASNAKIQAAKSAKGALTTAIIGFFCFGIILGPIAISQARKAKAVLTQGDDGYGNAQAAEIIGWIVLALYVVFLGINLLSMCSGAYSY